MPEVMTKLRAVSDYRAKSKRKSTLAIKDAPTKFNVEVVPDRSFLALPEASSERRHYIPIGWLEPPIIPSNLLRALTYIELFARQRWPGWDAWGNEVGRFDEEGKR